MLILPELLLIILSFLLGSISSAIIICRMMKITDPRTQGSKNPGATNVLRIGSRKAAAITLVADGVKGVIPVALAFGFGMDLFTASLVGLAAFLGHVYPIWFGFKGGKGVATFLGVLLALNIWVGIASILTWLFVAKILRISSLSALIMAVLTPVYFYFISTDITSTIVIVVISILIFWTHRGNIKRLLSKEEVRSI